MLVGHIRLVAFTWAALAVDTAASTQHEVACSAGQDSDSCRAPATGSTPPLAGDHLMLQMKQRLAVQQQEQGEARRERQQQLQAEEAPGDFDDAPTAPCAGMVDVEKSCSTNQCLVLATGMRGQSCDNYCARNWRRCIAAWEEVDETCGKQKALRCDEVYGQTSDLLCQCSVPRYCTGLRNVDKTCSPNGCKVLADKMTGRTCAQYCGEQGLTCIGAAEEVDETCGEKQTLSCDESFPGTSDLLCECAPPAQGAPPPLPGGGPPPDVGDLTLVWSDEFDGSSVDHSKWEFVTGGGGWGNAELQYYTDRSSNAYVRGGTLSIRARCERYHRDSFTSAKLHTKGLADWGPGHRIDVRARLPTGKGTWPAIWMLPTDSEYGRWPRSGEIDIMEAVGCTSRKVYGTVHTQAYNHMKHTEKFNSLSTDVTAWHTYTIVWEADRIRWYMDDQHYHTFHPSSLSSEKWPFNKRFHLILNLAVGGSWGGKCLHGRPSCSSRSEFGVDQIMEVDYARIYRL